MYFTLIFFRNKIVNYRSSSIPELDCCFFRLMNERYCLFCLNLCDIGEKKTKNMILYLDRQKKHVIVYCIYTVFILLEQKE